MDDSLWKHGRKKGLKKAESDLCRLKELGIDLDAITEQLQADGITAFAASFDPVPGAVEEKHKRIVQAQSPPRERKRKGS